MRNTAPLLSTQGAVLLEVARSLIRLNYANLAVSCASPRLNTKLTLMGSAIEAMSATHPALFCSHFVLSAKEISAASMSGRHM